MPIDTESTHVREQEALAQCFAALNKTSCFSLPIESQDRFRAKKKAVMYALRYMAFLLADEGSDEVADENAKLCGMPEE
jgi:hypothetical protein